ncbi:hypothetical protein [Eubacterium sp.]
MAGLQNKSKLYEELLKMYESKTDEGITFDLFNDCVDMAIKYNNKREAKFIIFELKSLYDEKNTGNEIVNKVCELTSFFVGNSRRALFIMTVLETALDEM